MKTKPTPRQKSSAACPRIRVAAGKRCVLGAGGLRNEPHADRNVLAAAAPEKSQGAIIKGAVNVPKKKKKDSFAARLARLKTELAQPHLTRSVREKATKQQIESWDAG